MAKHARPVVLQLLALILLNWLITPLIVFGQTQERVVHLLSANDQPVELQLKIADEVIIADKPFVAIDDWLKDLSWRIKNTSDKAIVCVEVELDFHGSSKAERVYTFRYGQKPDAEGASGDPKLLKPGETANFKLSDTEYNEIKQFVAQKHPTEGVSTAMSVVELKIASVFFDGRNMWKPQQASTDSVVQFLLTAAANDFHTHRPPDPARFRDVRLGHVMTPDRKEQYLLCGQFLPTQEAGKAEWTPFATIKTSGYEQWIGAQAEHYCESASLTWDKVGDLSSSLQSRLDSLR